VKNSKSLSQNAAKFTHGHYNMLNFPGRTSDFPLWGGKGGKGKTRGSE